jgi:hypothetical protein
VDDTTLRLIPVSEFPFRPSTNRDSATNLSRFVIFIVA